MVSYFALLTRCRIAKYAHHTESFDYCNFAKVSLTILLPTSALQTCVQAHCFFDMNIYYLEGCALLILPTLM